MIWVCDVINNFDMFGGHRSMTFALPTALSVSPFVSLHISPVWLPCACALMAPCYVGNTNWKTILYMTIRKLLLLLLVLLLCFFFCCCVILRVNRSDLLRLLAAVSLNPPHLSAYHKTYTHTYAYINCVCVCARVCRYVSKLFICLYPRIVMLNSTCASSDFTILPLSRMICAKTKKKRE